MNNKTKTLLLQGWKNCWQQQVPPPVENAAAKSGATKAQWHTATLRLINGFYLEKRRNGKKKLRKKEKLNKPRNSKQSYEKESNSKKIANVLLAT